MACNGGKSFQAHHATQLALIFSAAHSTIDLLRQTILNLAEGPELVDELRQEIIAVREGCLLQTWFDGQRTEGDSAPQAS